MNLKHYVKSGRHTYASSILTQCMRADKLYCKKAQLY